MMSRVEGTSDRACRSWLSVASDRGGELPACARERLGRGLSPPGDQRTITLEQPITHPPSGPGSGFVRAHRYTTLVALKHQPRTTTELLRHEREN
jgi:hypothetical protein